MSIVEVLIYSPADLAAPAGVTFPAKSRSRAADLAAWNELMPALWTEMLMGRYIMAVLQCRAMTDKAWDDAKHNFTGMDPAEDSILAAYCLGASLGNPYTPGLCSADWVKNLMAANMMGVALENMKPVARNSTSMFQVFQCAPEGFKLAARGCMALLQNYNTHGPPGVETAAGATVKDMVRPERWGWRGGTFPKLITKRPGR